MAWVELGGRTAGGKLELEATAGLDVLELGTTTGG